MSGLRGLQEQMMADALRRSRGDDMLAERYYNEALNYLKGMAQAKINGDRGGAPSSLSLNPRRDPQPQQELERPAQMDMSHLAPQEQPPFVPRWTYGTDPYTGLTDYNDLQPAGWMPQREPAPAPAPAAPRPSFAASPADVGQAGDSFNPLGGRRREQYNAMRSMQRGKWVM